MIDVDLWSLNKTIVSSEHWQLVREASRREFAFDAIFGGNTGEPLAICNVQILPNLAIVIQADTEGIGFFDDGAIKQRQKEIYNKVGYMLEQDVDGIVTVAGQENIFATTVGELDVAILLPVNLREGQGNGKAIAKRYARHIKAHLSKDLQYSISLGIGQVYEFKNIRQSYFEACAALKYKFYQGSGAIIHYSEVSWGNKESQRLFLEYETKLLSYVRKGEWQSAAITVVEMLDTLGDKKRVHPDTLKVRVLELLTVVSRGVMDLGGNPDTLLDIKIRSGEEIVKVATLADMRVWLPGIINEMCALLKEKQQAAIVRAISNVKQYIAENYYLDISLEELAKREYLSASYLCRAFTEHVGISFTDYLKAVRIQRAQALLLSTSKGVAEIAVKVGYHDPNYFSRVFRVVTGKSPQQYRQGAMKPNVKYKAT